MLKYKSLTAIEQEMVQEEIRSNYNTSVKSGFEYQRMTENVQKNLYCCNCFRSEKNCCCDTIKGCLDLEEIQDEDYI